MTDTEVKCNSTIFARDVANERADVMSPEGVHNAAAAVAAEHGLALHSLVGPQLTHEGLHLLHAVGQSAV